MKLLDIIFAVFMAIIGAFKTNGENIRFQIFMKIRKKILIFVS